MTTFVFEPAATMALEADSSQTSSSFDFTNTDLSLGDCSSPVQTMSIDPGDFRTLDACIAIDGISATAHVGSFHQHPIKLYAITPTPRLCTSHILQQVLNDNSSSFRALLARSLAGRVAAMCLQATAELLEPDDYSATSFDLAIDFIKQSLAQDVPQHAWHGQTTRYGRVHYLMTLLEEIVAGLAVPMEDVMADVSCQIHAQDACSRIERSIKKLGDRKETIVGLWMASQILSTSLFHFTLMSADPVVTSRQKYKWIVESPNHPFIPDSEHRAIAARDNDQSVEGIPQSPRPRIDTYSERPFIQVKSSDSIAEKHRPLDVLIPAPCDKANAGAGTLVGLHALGDQGRSTVRCRPSSTSNSHEGAESDSNALGWLDVTPCPAPVSGTARPLHRAELKQQVNYHTAQQSLDEHAELRYGKRRSSNGEFDGTRILKRLRASDFEGSDGASSIQSDGVVLPK